MTDDQAAREAISAHADLQLASRVDQYRSVEPWTERRVLDLLRDRHERAAGNGPSARWAYMEHVRNAASFEASRCIDALAMHLWASDLHFHAFEVKVSRSDWLRELATPWKSSVWADLGVDYFSVVAPYGVVKKDEMPSGWGLLEAGEGGLRLTKRATRLTSPASRMDRPEMDRGFVSCMLRAAVKTAKAAS